MQIRHVSSQSKIETNRAHGRGYVLTCHFLGFLWFSLSSPLDGSAGSSRKTEYVCLMNRSCSPGRTTWFSDDLDGARRKFHLRNARRRERANLPRALGIIATFDFSRVLEVHEEVLRIPGRAKASQSVIGRSMRIARNRRKDERRTSRTREAVHDLPSVNRSMLTLNESVLGARSSQT